MARNAVLLLSAAAASTPRCSCGCKHDSRARAAVLRMCSAHTCSQGACQTSTCKIDRSTRHVGNSPATCCQQKAADNNAANPPGVAKHMYHWVHPLQAKACWECPRRPHVSASETGRRCAAVLAMSVYPCTMLAVCNTLQHNLQQALGVTCQLESSTLVINYVIILLDVVRLLKVHYVRHA